METQTISTEVPLPPLSAEERRRYPRTLSDVEAVVRFKHGCNVYKVRNLSVCGALLTDGRDIEIDTIVEVDLDIQDHPMIRVMARVVRRGMHDAGARYLGVEFLHQSDHTEDMIQAALLDDIERSQTHGVILAFD